MVRKPTKKRPRAIFREKYQYSDGENPAHVYLDSLGEDSQRTMGAALESVADILTNGRIGADDLAWHLIRSNHVNALRGRLQELYAPSTGNRYLSALRGVLKDAWRLQQLDRETMERTLDVPPIRGSRESRGRAVVLEELRAVFRACRDDDNEAFGARDAAILAVLYGTGLRRAEAAAIDLESVDLKTGSIVVVGKGNKQRTVYLPNGTRAAVQEWLRVRGTHPGALFTRIAKRREAKPHGITDQLIYHIVRKRHLKAGVAPFTPHDLRRSFISELLDDGVDLATVAKQVGHSNVQTTARYDRRESRAQKEGVLKLDVPFGETE